MTTITKPARWLDALSVRDAELRRALVERAMLDIGIEEGEANRSPYIDELIADCGLTPGQPWCAAAVNRWCKDVGVARPPRGQASCDVWMVWAKRQGSWRDRTHSPSPGDIVVYGKPGDANHIGVVARVSHRGPRSVEGNTSFAGFSREGIVCDYKVVDTARVLGYIVPEAAK